MFILLNNETLKAAVTIHTHTHTHIYTYNKTKKTGIKMQHNNEVGNDGMPYITKDQCFELIRKHFEGIYKKNNVHRHPLCLLIAKFCNLFHGKYSFSPEMFKQKSMFTVARSPMLLEQAVLRFVVFFFFCFVSCVVNSYSKFGFE